MDCMKEIDSYFQDVDGGSTSVVSSFSDKNYRDFAYLTTRNRLIDIELTNKNTLKTHSYQIPPSNTSILGHLGESYEKRPFVGILTVPDNDPQHLSIIGPFGLDSPPKLIKTLNLKASGPWEASTAGPVGTDGKKYSEVVFAKSDKVLRVCFDTTRNNFDIRDQTVFDLSSVPNPLKLTHVVNVAYGLVAGMPNDYFVFVSRGNATFGHVDSARSGDIVVLSFSSNSCKIYSDFNHPIFVHPPPFALSAPLIGDRRHLFYLTQPNQNNGQFTGWLYGWDLSTRESYRTKISTLPGNRFLDFGFPVVEDENRNPFGIIGQQKEGSDSSEWLSTIYSMRDGHPKEYCKSVVSTKYSVPKTMISFNRLNGIEDPSPILLGISKVGAGVGITRFKFFVPYKKRSVEDVENVEEAKGLCAPISFGYPETCVGCPPPSSICGTSDCSEPGTCCFVMNGQVACCETPPDEFKGTEFNCGDGLMKK